uniref:Uncharacterized protein n=1 Tax=Oryza meridionalis TaxID=40149 RepID=A0A0E0E1Q3_9ORYZ
MAVAAVLVVVEGACRPPLSLSGALPPPLRRPPPSPPPDPMAAVAVVVKEAREMETGTVRWPARRLGQGQCSTGTNNIKTKVPARKLAPNSQFPTESSRLDRRQRPEAAAVAGLMEPAVQMSPFGMSSKGGRLGSTPSRVE